jgi:parallel beta-helix repeat protein
MKFLNLGIIILFIIALAIPAYAAFSINTEPVPPHNVENIIQESSLEIDPVKLAMPIENEPLDPGCPTDDTYINTDIILTNETCYVNDTNNNGVLIINASDITLDCNGMILIGNRNGYAIHMNKENITIKNCLIKNYSKGIGIETNYSNIFNNTLDFNRLDNIQLKDSTNVNIYNNHIINNIGFFGILLEDSTNVNIYNNHIVNNLVGIELINSTNITISDNNISDNDYSIVDRSTLFTDIKNNLITDAHNTAIFVFDNSTNGSIRNNVINTTLSRGVVISGYGWMIENNSISNFHDGGLVLFESENFIVTHNIFKEGMDNALSFYESGNNTITNNTFCKNNLSLAIFIRFTKNASNNSFYYNNFFKGNMTPPVIDLLNNFWDNGNYGNYWEDYSGIDNNNDGVGDVPYIINVANNTSDNYPLMNPNPNAPPCEPLQNDTEPEIIYSSFKDNISVNVWGMQPDGTNKIQITSHPDYEFCPMWSPDNSKISFTSNRTGNFGLWIMNADSTNQTLVIHNVSGLYGDWSPDGNNLVYASDVISKQWCTIGSMNFNKDCEIYIVSIDGSNVTRLTNDDFDDADPRWSPNGKEIIFISDRTNDTELWLINSDGTNLRQLTFDGKPKGTPAWSPDGSKIAFLEETNNTSIGLWLINSDGTNKRLIKDFNNSFPVFPSFSPDGQKITYTLVDSLAGVNNLYIYVVDIDGINNVRLTTGGPDVCSDWRNGPTGNDTTPPLAPTLFKAILTGANYEDVEISWYASSDEGQIGGTTKYELWKSTEFNGVYSYVRQIPATGSPTYAVTQNLEGDGSPSNYFYFIRSVDTANNTADSWYAGKFAQNLTSGWKFVSIPLEQYDTSLETVLQTLDFDQVRYYNASDIKDNWKGYWTFKSYKGDLKDIDHKMGFWVHVTNDDYLTTAGLVPVSTGIMLYEGWNMVGYPSFINRTIDEALQWIPWTSVEGFDPNLPPFHLKKLLPTDIMSAGNAYWIEVTGNNIWIVYNL